MQTPASLQWAKHLSRAGTLLAPPSFLPDFPEGVVLRSCSLPHPVLSLPPVLPSVQPNLQN